MPVLQLWNVFLKDLGATFLKCKHQGKEGPHLPVSMRVQFSPLAPNSDYLPVRARRETSLFFQVKTINKHRWSPQLPSESRMNGWRSTGLARPPTWGVLTIYLESTNVEGCICLTGWEGETSFCRYFLFSWLPVMRIPFCLNPHSIINWGVGIEMQTLRTDLWTLWGKEKLGWINRVGLMHTHYYI